MKINVISHFSEVTEEKITGKTAVVIDVFRATSVMVTALAHGAKEIIAAGSVEQAWAAYRLQDPAACILGGEHQMKKIPGFHCGNSPSEYTHETIAGKTIILNTTNGTHAIDLCRRAARLYTCSFLNCAGVASQLTLQDNDLVIVCAGSFNTFSLEDALCAGMLVGYLANLVESETDDFTASLMLLYDGCGANIKHVLANNCRAFRELVKNHLEADIDFCLQRNIYTIAPMYSDGKIKIQENTENKK